MIALLGTLSLVAHVSQMSVSSVQDEAVGRCRTRLEQKLNSEITEFNVAKTRRIGRTIVLSGTLASGTRASQRPGEMSPHHVILSRFSFECRSTGRKVPNVKLAPLGL
jgi:hypothetical protein